MDQTLRSGFSIGGVESTPPPGHPEISDAESNRVKSIAALVDAREKLSSSLNMEEEAGFGHVEYNLRCTLYILQQCVYSTSPPQVLP